MTNVHEFPLRFSGESGGTEFEFEINQPEHLPNYFQMVFLDDHQPLSRFYVQIDNAMQVFDYFGDCRHDPVLQQDLLRSVSLALIALGFPCLLYRNEQ